MKLYDFSCEKCNFEFEKRVKNMDEIVLCPQCNTIAKRQFPNAMQFILKGGAWFKDGYEKPKTTSQIEKE